MRLLQLRLGLVVTLMVVCSYGISLAQTKPQASTLRDPATFAVQREAPMVSLQHDLGWLVHNSNLVFTGYLVGQDVEEDERGLIVTRNHFEIERVIMGNLKARNITLSTLGGTLGERTLRVSHMPVFSKNNQYVIFAAPQQHTYNPVTGNERGVFLVGLEDAGVYTYEGVSVASTQKGLIQLGGHMLESHVHRVFRKPSLLPQGQGIQGNFIAAEQADSPPALKRAEQAVKPAIPLEQFVASIRQLADTK